MKKAGGRRITRSKEEWGLDDMERRNRLHSEKLKRRKEIVVYLLDTMKRSMNQGYFPMRGLSEVGTEMNLTIIDCNMKRVIMTWGLNGWFRLTPEPSFFFPFLAVTILAYYHGLTAGWATSCLHYFIYMSFIPSN
jgi:hypothetical protein